MLKTNIHVLRSGGPVILPYYAVSGPSPLQCQYRVLPFS